MSAAVNKPQAQLAKCGVRVRFTYQGEERESTHYLPCITIGRSNGSSSPDLDLSPDTNVSRNHARIVVDGNCVRLCDLGSKNGTTVNDQPATADVVLRDGDRVGFGSIVGVYRSSAAGMSTETQGGQARAKESQKRPTSSSPSLGSVPDA